VSAAVTVFNAIQLSHDIKLVIGSVFYILIALYLVWLWAVIYRPSLLPWWLLLPSQKKSRPDVMITQDGNADGGPVT
jgi:hypothetical protein